MNEGVDLFDLVDKARSWLARFVPVFDIDAADIRSLLMFLFVVVVVFFVGVLIREVATSYELDPHRRVRYLVRATRTPRWSTEDLERWAAQLSMSRRRVRSHIDRPAHAVRIRLESSPDGPRYTIEGSRRLAAIMRSPVLSDVSVTPIPPRDGRRWATRGRRR